MALLLALALACASAPTCLASAPLNSKPDEPYIPRLIAPSKKTDEKAQLTDIYRYYHSKENPYNLSYGRRSYSMRACGGNCTAYAFGRAFELLGVPPILPDCTRTYGPSDGGNWMHWNEKTGAYKTGQIPRLGAIACWQRSGGGQNGGHVAIVEKIHNGIVTVSESAYGSFYFQTREIELNTAPGVPLLKCGNMKFLGFIYLLDNAGGTAPGDPILLKARGGDNALAWEL